MFKLVCPFSSPAKPSIMLKKGTEWHCCLLPRELPDAQEANQKRIQSRSEETRWALAIATLLTDNCLNERKFSKAGNSIEHCIYCLIDESRTKIYAGLEGKKGREILDKLFMNYEDLRGLAKR